MIFAPGAHHERSAIPFFVPDHAATRVRRNTSGPACCVMQPPGLCPRSRNGWPTLRAGQRPPCVRWQLSEAGARILEAENARKRPFLQGFARCVKTTGARLGAARLWDETHYRTCRSRQDAQSMRLRRHQNPRRRPLGGCRNRPGTGGAGKNVASAARRPVHHGRPSVSTTKFYYLKINKLKLDAAIPPARARLPRTPAPRSPAPPSAGPAPDRRPPLPPAGAVRRCVPPRARPKDCGRQQTAQPR